MGWFEEGYSSTHGNFKREMMKLTAFCGILLSEKSGCRMSHEIHVMYLLVINVAMDNSNYIKMIPAYPSYKAPLTSGISNRHEPRCGLLCSSFLHIAGQCKAQLPSATTADFSIFEPSQGPWKL